MKIRLGKAKARRLRIAASTHMNMTYGATLQPRGTPASSNALLSVS